MFFTEHVGRWWLLSYLPVANLLTCSLQNTSAAGGYSPPKLLVQLMSKPTFTPDLSYIQIIAALYFVMAYSPFVNYLVVNLVREKELKIKENMRIMGLQDTAFW